MTNRDSDSPPDPGQDPASHAEPPSQPQTDPLSDPEPASELDAFDSNGETSTVTSDAASTERGHIADYQILERVGTGGMGEVFRAEQIKPLRRIVALKVIKRGMDTEAIVRRFEAESQALALMEHPCIAKVFDAGSTPRGRPYFAMEYVKGVPINVHCDKQKLSTRERLELFIQLCEGVQHAHQKAIIHRDLKPSNVLVTIQDDRWVPKIIDFGVAKAMAHKLTEKTMYTALGELIGTPEYMSPEQAELTGQDVDTRTDVYSLGVILYELLAGALPFDPTELRSAGFEGVRRIIGERDPPRPSTRVSTLGDRTADVATARSTAPAKLIGQLRGDLDWVTMRALEKDRTRRYASASELAADLQRYLRHEPVLASPPSTAYRMKKFAKRHRVAVTTAVTVSLLVLGFAITMTVQATRLAHERNKVARESAHRKEVSDFLTNLFTDIDPFLTGGEGVTLREILDRGAARVAEQLEGQPSVQSDLMLTLGSVYRDLGLLEPAAPLLEEALRLRRNLHGDEHVDVAMAMAALAHLERMRDNIERADSLFVNTLQILERRPETDPADLADVLHEFAVVRRHEQKFSDAESLYVRVLELRKKTLGERDPLVGKTLSDLGLLYYFADRLEDAEAITRDALHIHANSDPPNYIWWGESLSNMGAFLRRREEHEEAVAVLTQALEIQHKALGSEHPNIARTLSHLGETYYKMGRYEEALRQQEEALKIYVATYGECHTTTALTLRRMAIVNRAMQNYDAALDQSRRNVIALETTLGPRHPQVAEGLVLQGEIYQDMRSFEAAERAFQRSLKIQSEAYGDESTQVTAVLEAYVALLAEAGRTAAADSMTKRIEHNRAQATADHSSP